MQTTLRAADGYELAADHFTSNSPKVAVVIASATGVPRRMYRQFAEFLAAHDVAVLTFDYRGIGGSRPSGSLRGFEATAEQWGTLDLEGAIAQLTSDYPHLPLVIVAHSIGGQLLGLAPSSNKASAAVFIASQSGYWRLWDGVPRIKLWLYWYVVFPVLLRLFGYLPMKMIAGGEDLPRGMAQEWMEWGRRPNYVLTNRRAQEELGYERFTAPIRSYAFSDDRDYAPRRAVEALLGFYRNAPSEFCFIHPEEVGAKRIGHFSSFRAPFRDTLWMEWKDWIVSHRSTAPG
jgi:predicted alpha/beta hydrolase